MLAGFLKTRADNKRHYVLVMAFVFVLVIGVLGWWVLPQRAAVDSALAPDVLVATTTPDYGRSNPVRLVIPSLTIDTTFVPPLGLQPDQSVSVPDSYDQVGWYSGGATPGENGPAVILGHVDSVTGPAIFYSLGQLKMGDDIEITRADGTTVTFVVTKLQRYPQVNFPTLDVYGPTDAPTLRLVTCTGTFNRGEQRYSHNLVVYATLKLSFLYP